MSEHHLSHLSRWQRWILRINALVLLFLVGAVPLTYARNAALPPVHSDIPLHQTPGVSSDTARLVSREQTKSPGKLHIDLPLLAFELPEEYVVKHWNPVDDIVYSASIYRQDFLDNDRFGYQLPEVSVTAYDRRNFDLDQWLEQSNVTDDHPFAADNNQYYLGRSTINKSRIEGVQLAAFEHKAMGIPIHTTLFASGPYIYSVSYTQFDGLGIEEDYLVVVEALLGKKTSRNIKNHPQVRELLNRKATDSQSSKTQDTPSKRSPLSLFINWLESSVKSAHASEQLSGYKLPWDADKTVKLTQGWKGEFSHGGKDEEGKCNGTMCYAYDFGLKEGDTIRASRAGTIKYIKGDSTECGGSDYSKKANYVVINHDDGTATVYLHLQSVSVDVGKSVAQGDVVGESGKTGWTASADDKPCGPHLHFQRQPHGSSYWGISEEIYFDEYPGQELLTGNSYTSQNYSSDTGGCRPPSTGNWLISSRCEITQAVTAPADIVVGNNALLIVHSTGTINANLTNHKIVVQNGSGILVKNGGKIY